MWSGLVRSIEVEQEFLSDQKWNLRLVEKKEIRKELRYLNTVEDLEASKPWRKSKKNSGTKN